jgi:ribosomal protein L7/L12
MFSQDVSLKKKSSQTFVVQMSDVKSIPATVLASLPLLPAPLPSCVPSAPPLPPLRPPAAAAAAEAEDTTELDFAVEKLQRARRPVTRDWVVDVLCNVNSIREDHGATQSHQLLGALFGGGYVSLDNDELLEICREGKDVKLRRFSIAKGTWEPCGLDLPLAELAILEYRVLPAAASPVASASAPAAAAAAAAGSGEHAVGAKRRTVVVIDSDSDDDVKAHAAKRAKTDVPLPLPEAKDDDDTIDCTCCDGDHVCGVGGSTMAFDVYKTGTDGKRVLEQSCTAYPVTQRWRIDQWAFLNKRSWVITRIGDMTLATQFTLKPLPRGAHRMRGIGWLDALDVTAKKTWSVEDARAYLRANLDTYSGARRDSVKHFLEDPLEQLHCYKLSLDR